ncbi:protein methyltransferase [Venturia nashicola]|uniref:Protein methyltransferase n=1 Tax=Venturia nashicola TaxID=86259 RepID=A0A4Z1NSB2_9PEZI|nr:protein methyltransferase [Venturia nashicola]TLD19014.1 protein methyltransferase [Venturia nashicola]
MGGGGKQEVLDTGLNNGQTPVELRKIESNMTMDRVAGLELRLDTPKGRGIFTSIPIPHHTIIETCPILVLPSTDPGRSTESTLYHYTYNWPVTRGTKTTIEQAIILGLGSMFNHSTLHQNVGWERDIARGVVVYKALRDINEGEELCQSHYPTKSPLLDESPTESLHLLVNLHHHPSRLFSCSPSITPQEEHRAKYCPTGISYGDRLWFKDTDATTSEDEDEDEEDYLGNIQIDS